MSAKRAVTARSRGELLSYPLYLDVPMMISFLAAIEDGVAYDTTVQRRSASSHAGGGDVEARVGLPSFLGLLPFDLRGRLTGEARGGESEELQLVRKHTEASLFNRLRNMLHDDKLVKSLDRIDDAIAENVAAHDIVEIGGEILRNPLGEIFTLFDRIRSLSEPAVPTPSRPHGKGQRPVGAQKAPEQDLGMRVIEWAEEDFRAAPMQDVLLRVPGEGERSCVLTLGQGPDTGFRLDHLLGAQLRVIGKVTSVLGPGESLSLLRRSALGYMQESSIRDAINGLRELPDLHLSIGETNVVGPALQILPVAIFT